VRLLPWEYLFTRFSAVVGKKWDLRTQENVVNAQRDGEAHRSVAVRLRRTTVASLMKICGSWFGLLLIGPYARPPVTLAMSFIVRGRGNAESFHSCSHGAGRRMSRTAARNAVTPTAFEASLKGTFSKPSMGYADEAPQAYKNIATVIGRQTDLVDVLHELRPIITIKGDSRAKDD